MTRTASFAALGLLVCGCVLGDQRPETSTYVDGNVAALKPNTGGTLVFSDSKASPVSHRISRGLRTLRRDPQSGARRHKVHSHDAPAYKVWTRLHKTETQLLTVRITTLRAKTEP